MPHVGRRTLHLRSLEPAASDRHCPAKSSALTGCLAPMRWCCTCRSALFATLMEITARNSWPSVAPEQPRPDQPRAHRRCQATPDRCVRQAGTAPASRVHRLLPDWGRLQVRRQRGEPMATSSPLVPVRRALQGGLRRQQDARAGNRAGRLRAHELHSPRHSARRFQPRPRPRAGVVGPHPQVGVRRGDRCEARAGRPAGESEIARRRRAARSR